MPAYTDPTPEWLKSKLDPSVLDSPFTKVIRALATAIGADDPASQVMGIAGAKIPGGKRRTADLLDRILGPSPPLQRSGNRWVLLPDAPTFGSYQEAGDYMTKNGLAGRVRAAGGYLNGSPRRFFIEVQADK